MSTEQTPQESHVWREEQQHSDDDTDHTIEEELGDIQNFDDDDMWTYEKEEKLIDLYKRYTFLYDKSKPRFQVKNIKEGQFKPLRKYCKL